MGQFKNRQRRLAYFRRASQIIFFLIFTRIIVQRKAPSSEVDGTQISDRTNFFFRLDPLSAITTALTKHAFHWWFLWSIALVIASLLLGRFLCGWICPLGSLNHFLASLAGSRRRRITTNRYKPWQTTKYYVLISGLFLIPFGCSFVGWIDPFSLLSRTMCFSIWPTAVSAKYTPVAQPHYWLSIVTVSASVVMLAMNVWVTRFWCRSLCPLGALLGVIGRWSLLRLDKSSNPCNHCAKCLTHCQGGDDPIGDAPWRKTECFLCMNCVSSCPMGILRFHFGGRDTAATGLNLSRRKGLVAMTIGIAAAPVLHAEALFGIQHRQSILLRPPGALDEESFVSLCIRCGECVKACPSHALHPAFAEGGFMALWTPMLAPSVGYCEPGCVACSSVCPTGAIVAITPQQKGWQADGGAESTRLRLGTAIYDRNRCLPWAKAVDCTVCKDCCPVFPKAILIDNATAIDADGKPRTIQRPSIDITDCVGCGACQYACPLEPPAVYVTRAGESRMPATSWLILKT